MQLVFRSKKRAYKELVILYCKKKINKKCILQFHYYSCQINYLKAILERLLSDNSSNKKRENHKPVCETASNLFSVRVRNVGRVKFTCFVYRHVQRFPHELDTLAYGLRMLNRRTHCYYATTFLGYVTTCIGLKTSSLFGEC